jgi:hypothetical protein
LLYLTPHKVKSDYTPKDRAKEGKREEETEGRDGGKEKEIY